MKSGKEERVRYWDIVKGITIVMMILGHQEGIPYTLRATIYSFHMPIFFVANGYFLGEYKTGKVLAKSIKSLIRPYLVVCLMVAVLAPVIYTNQSAILVFLDKIKAMLGGMSKIGRIFTSFQSVWLVWFVACLFVTRNLYTALSELVFSLKTRFAEHLRVIVIIVLALLGYFLGNEKFWLPWSIDVALVSLVFIWYGDFLRRGKILEKTWFKGLVAISGMIWMTLCMRNDWIELAVRSYKGGALSVMNALAGSTVIIGFSVLFDRWGQKWTEWNIDKVNQFFAWAGQESMVILAVHCLELIFFNWTAQRLMYLPESVQWVIKFCLRTIVILLITLLYSECKKWIKHLNEEC